MNFKNSCDGIYKNSLDVRFTKKCDNKCAFCIERNGLSGKKVNVEKMIESTLSSGKETVLILGGEPLLEIDKVLTYVKAIRSQIKEIYITTSLPNTINEKWEVFAEIMNTIDGLNVSLQHYLPTINNEVLNSTSKHNRLELLSKICENETFAKKVRVSINLVKGYIDSKFHIDTFLYIMECMHVQHVKINELQNEPNLYVNFEDVYGYKMKSPYAHGCQSIIDLDNHNLKITLKRACFCVNENLEATGIDCLKALLKKTFLKNKFKNSGMLVLYEDGSLSAGWKSKVS